jgi:3-oxoacyl-[acyl-carrier protein] reductase
VQNSNEFVGKVALVTGGTRGIGRAVVWSFAHQGCRVAFCYHSNRTAADDLCREAEAKGFVVEGEPVDVADATAVTRWVDGVLARHERVDILVNNAGSFPKQTVLEMSHDDWERVLRLNLSSVFYCCKAVLPAMIRQGGGAIVNLASIAGKRGSAYHAHYAAAKGGVLALTRSLARELIVHNIRVNAVCPGRIETDLLLADAGSGDQERWRADTPFRRLGTAEEVAAAVLFLASSAASYIVGETLDVDGGLLMD